MRLLTRTIAKLMLLIALALGALCALSATALSGTPLAKTLTATAGNAALDISGVKGQADSALRSKVPDISSATGLSEKEVNGAIDRLDISSWKMIALPDDAQKAGSFASTYGGEKATVTTYRDPSYVTLTTCGQDVTLSVPENARSYVPYLRYLS